MGNINKSLRVVNINKRSDFKLLIELKNYDGRSFRLRFFTSNLVKKEYVCSYIDNIYTNCEKVDDTHVMCFFNDNVFFIGMLYVQTEYSKGDSQQPDGVFSVVSKEEVIAQIENEYGELEDVRISIGKEKTEITNTPQSVITLIGMSPGGGVSVTIEIPVALTEEYAEELYKKISDNGTNCSYRGVLPDGKTVHLEVNDIEDGFMVGYSTRHARIYLTVVKEDDDYTIDESYIAYD